ncbi:MAG: DUF732 domain-containing protein [Mycobacterium sp.]
MFTRITTLIAGAVVFGMAVVGSGTANADPNQDNQYLQVLGQDGITITNADDVIKAAHDFCGALSDGVSPDQITQDLVNTASSPKQTPTTS